MNPPDGPQATTVLATAVLATAVLATAVDPTPPDGAMAVCDLSRLIINRGVCAMVAGHPVALFLLADGTVRAIDNVDPCSGASVLSRGLIGDVDGEPTVASPLHKQRFSLLDGRCLDVEGLAVGVHRAAVIDGTVWVGL